MSAVDLSHAAISADVAALGAVRVEVLDEIPEHARWCRSVPGVTFKWFSPTGAVVEQYRPDEPVVVDGEPRKYLWPKGQAPVLNVHPLMDDRVHNSTNTLVVVEGTKQHLAAVTAAVELDLAVIGIAGCYGWMSDGAPIADLGAINWVRPVVVIFDADVATNPNVHGAAKALSDELVVRGATSVRFARLPDGGSSGLDDVLASRAGVNGTSPVLAGIVKAAGKLPPAPRGPSARFFNQDGLRVELLVDELREQLRLAVDPGDGLLTYEHGRYVDGRHVVRSALGNLLGDQYRPMHDRAVVELLVAHLAAEGVVVPAGPAGGLVNVANGLLDPFTGRLSDHSPDHLSTVQLPTRWDRAATCPTFDAWLDEVTDHRGADLLEAVALLLDGRGERQRKAVFLHGPTRSGKSTFIRLIEAVVGGEARSAVTLHDLAGNRFAAADLFGKVLNTANELSAAHVDDLSTFKAVTGDDPVRAERKYGQPFTFRNRALFLFAANEIPTVGEVSGAYLARIRPYRFPHSYEGREDPAIERQMRDELPGILVRLVEALNRFETRGGYADDDQSRSALDDFARHSDRVRLFLHETTEPADDRFVPRTHLFEQFERWCQVNRRQPLGRHRFFDHVETAGYRAAKRQGVRGFTGLDLLAEADWGGPDNSEAPMTPTKPAPSPAAPLPGETTNGHPARGQVGQVFHTPASREDFGEGEREGLVKAGCAEPAPSAPSETPRDSEREEVVW